MQDAASFSRRHAEEPSGAESGRGTVGSVRYLPTRLHPPPRTSKPADHRRLWTRLQTTLNTDIVGSRSLIASTPRPRSLRMSTGKLSSFLSAGDGRSSNAQVGKVPEALLPARCTSMFASDVKRLIIHTPEERIRHEVLAHLWTTLC